MNIITLKQKILVRLKAKIDRFDEVSEMYDIFTMGKQIGSIETLYELLEMIEEVD